MKTSGAQKVDGMPRQPIKNLKFFMRKARRPTFFWHSEGAPMSVLERAELRKTELAQVGDGRSALVLGKALLRLGVDFGNLDLIPLPSVNGTSKGGGFKLRPTSLGHPTPLRVAAPNLPRKVKEVDRSGGKHMDSIPSRIRLVLHQMPVVNGHRVDHDTRGSPTTIGGSDSIGKNHRRVKPQVIDPTLVVSDGELITVNGPTKAPQRGRDRPHGATLTVAP